MLVENVKIKNYALYDAGHTKRNSFLIFAIFQENVS